MHLPRLHPRPLSIESTTAEFTELQVEPLLSVDEVRDEWERLARVSGNLFASAPWIEGWIRHTSDIPHCSFFWACKREDGSLAALLPLVLVEGRYVSKLRFAGFGAGWEFGPICAAEDLASACDALRLVLSLTETKWDAFVGEDLPGGGWAGRLAGRFLHRVPSPIVRIAWDDWDAYLATRSRQCRHELRRFERRAAERGFTFRLVEEEDELPAALDALFEQHLKRWGELASPWFVGREGFFREFAADARARGWLRLLLAERSGEIVAASLGFRLGDTEWMYQSSRDVAVDTNGLGILVMAEALKRAIADGIKEFKLGPGGQSYKMRLATHDHGLETVGIARTLRGRAALRRIRP